MGELVAEGKVRHLGICNVTADQVMAAHQAHPLAAVQAEYSLWTREPERELLPVLARAGHRARRLVAARRRLLRGRRRRGGRTTSGRTTRASRAPTSRRTATATRRCATWPPSWRSRPAQLALAWLLHRAADLVPIPGTRSPEHLDENLAAARVELDAATLARIDAVAPAGAAAGAALLSPRGAA